MLKKLVIGAEQEIFILLWQLGSPIQQMPSLALLKGHVDTLPEGESRGVKDALAEYEEASADIKVVEPSELPILLEAYKKNFDELRVGAVLQTARIILEGHEDGPKLGKGKNARVAKGAADALAYINLQQEKGLLFSRKRAHPPIIAGNESLLDFYTDVHTRHPLINVGLGNGARFAPGEFVGVMGYMGDGKSTLTRFMAYSAIVLQKKRVLHISFEEENRWDDKKYQLLHSHNPYFQNAFKSLTWEKYYGGGLKRREQGMLDVVTQDFRRVVEDNLVIYQPSIKSWDACKEAYELQSQDRPVDIMVVDYLGMIRPTNTYETREAITAMVQDVRQFGLNNDLLIISPVQVNEEGRKKAENNDGIYDVDAVNNDKELGRSMTSVLGVFNWNSNMPYEGNDKELIISNAKGRNATFRSLGAKLSPSGWISGGAWSWGDAREQTVGVGDAIDDL